MIKEIIPKLSCYHCGKTLKYNYQRNWDVNITCDISCRSHFMAISSDYNILNYYELFCIYSFGGFSYELTMNEYWNNKPFGTLKINDNREPQNLVGLIHLNFKPEIYLNGNILDIEKMIRSIKCSILQ